MFTCKKCGKSKPADEMDVGREGRPNQSTCKTCRYKMQARWKRNHPSFSLTSLARRRSRVDGTPCNIDYTDVVVPEFCPVLGVRLSVGPGKIHDFSPTIDRIRPELGYTKGNIAVISYKANRIKNNGSLEDLQAVVRWMEKTLNPSPAPGI